MEMKNFVLILLAALGIVTSAVVYAGYPATGDTNAVEKATVPADGQQDPQWEWGKCPPFCT